MFDRLEDAPGVCIGLDPHGIVLPDLARWSCAVLDAIAPHAACVKPQIALYEQHGAPGFEALLQTCRHARALDLPVLLDAKRGDIGSTAVAYAEALFGHFSADAVTLSPYLGPSSLAPFLAWKRPCFVLLRTSNPDAHLWQADIAPRIAAWIRDQPLVGAVIGATVDEDWRQLLTDSWFLMPGIGAQGASVDDVRRHRREDGGGVLPTASRSILFGPDGLDGVERRARDFADAWSSDG